MYIAGAAYIGDSEIFKKHFAKAIGIDLINERVKVVQITIAQQLMKIPANFSRSVDKVRDHFLKDAKEDVKQFLVKDNKLKYI